jgi:uncharacterized YigZ family protein
MDSYRTIHTGGVGEVIEKKSRFIATISPVQTEEEALAFIDQIKKQYREAAHNCFAYTIGIRDEIQRCSDDGEPAKTAGRPILDVLLGEHIHNICVVVTRYFGGTLLGTGGLVRAYQGATKEGLNQCTLITKQYGIKLQIITDYVGIGKIQYLVATSDIITLDTEFTDIVKLNVLVPFESLDSFQKDIIESTNGKAEMIEMDYIYYSNTNNGVIMFEKETSR